MTRRTQPRTPTGARLTPQQLLCAAIAAEGLSNAEIGTRLGLAELTVKSHLGRAMAAAGAVDRANLVLLLLRDEQLVALDDNRVVAVLNWSGAAA